MTKFKRLLSILLILTITFPIIPIGELRAYAFDQEKFKVEEVTLIRNYDRDQNSISAIISIRGEYLKDASVRIFTNDGGFKTLPISSRDINDDNIIQYRLSSKDIGSELYVGNKRIVLDEQNMPNITSITTRKVEEGKELRLQGTNLNQVQYGNVKVVLDREGETEITSGFVVNGSEATVAQTKAKTLGQQNIIFKKSTTQQVNFNQLHPMVNVKVNITYTYQDQFLLYKPIAVDNLVMRPTRGIPGDIIYFESPVKGAETDLDKYDIFFIKTTDGTDSYRLDNKGKNTQFQPKVKKDGIEYNILTTQVPDKLPIGEYFVVLTNVVPAGQDPMKSISRELVLEQKFRVIDGEKKATISLIDPTEGPDTGGRAVEIIGKFFGTLNIDEFKPASSSQPVIGDPQVDTKTLVLSYGGGIYGEGANSILIDRVERKLKVIIGVEADFIKNDDGKLGEFNPASDKIKVRTGQVTDPGPKKVMVEITTIFHKNGGGTIEIIEIADNAIFTYTQSQIKPEITSVVPQLIEVKQSGTSYQIPEDRLIAIHGKNLMIHKYITDSGEQKLIYPEIRIGNIVLDKNKNPALDVKVLDSNGKVLDGTKGNELGVKILVKLPKSTNVTSLGKAPLRVTNPTRNSEIRGLFDNKEDFVEFVAPSEALSPVIQTVKPYTSPLEGGEQIVVEGSNFRPGVRVFIDGEEIKTFTRQEDGKKITFTTLKGREGETQLQIMNEEGGIATHPFIYVKTFSNPKITDFAPKKGNTGTLVMIKGNFFIKPETIGASDNIFKIIGSRVLLDGQEINDYNRNPNNKNIIELKPFNPNKPLFKKVEKRVEVADYYDAIMLKDNNDREYILDIKPNGEIILSDGALNIFNIQLDANGNMVAIRQGGEEQKLTVGNNSITLTNNLNEQTILTYLTPYTTSGSNIIGKKVKVVDNKTIYFTVPILQDEKYYDLTVINPDTKKDEKKGNAGFYYYTQPGTNPEILEIIPNEGSVDGGYSIDIIGKGFPRDTDTKPRVFINGVEVPEKDVQHSTDGEAIRVVSVPKYQGDLVQDKETSRWGVPVVVLNPNGSTASMEKGFFYVVPSSKPKLTSTDPTKASAGGGALVKIKGEQFRYFEPYDDKNRNGKLDEAEGETYNDLNGNGRWDNLLERKDYANIKEWEIAAGKTALEHDEYDYYYSSSILPKVYFGNEEAKIVEFEDGYIEVIAPKNKAGKVEVYLLNNDGGVSNKLQFTYEATPVTIKSMIPNVGPKEGGAEATLEGTGFSPTEIEIYKDTYTGGISDIEKKKMPLVRFGERTNENISWEDKKSGGKISAEKTKVELPGGLTVEYNGDAKTLTLTIQDGDTKYTKTIQGYNNDEKYIPVNLLKANGQPYNGKELIKVHVEGKRIGDGKIVDGKLVVERGYAPATTYINTGEIRVDTTPSYHTTGKNIPVFIINAEGGRGKTSYEYKNPESSPRITGLKADGRDPQKESRPDLDASTDVMVLKVNYRKGSTITVEGIDFRTGIKVRIGSLIDYEEGKEITLDGSTKLTFKMPTLPDGAVGTILPLTVINDDGASYSSAQRIPKIFIEITKGDTNPEITTIEPQKGPASGGTKIKITGKDLRKEMPDFKNERLRVSFGEIDLPESDIAWNPVDRSITIVAPKSIKLGKIEIKLTNPDGEGTQDGIFFEYISKPAIQDLSPNKIFTNDTKTEVTIKGEMFQPGAKVVVGGKIVDKKDIKKEMEVKGEGIIGVVGGINREVGVVGGIEAATVKVENDKTIKVTFPEAKDLDNTSLIIINPDGGISDPYDKFQYEKPVPNRPLILEGIPGYESTVQLIWSKSDDDVLNKAKSYEIYGRKTIDKDNTFIGSTTAGEFLVKGLEPETQYTFMVRALNEYGASISFSTVTVKTLNLRQDDKQREKEEKRKAEEEKIKANGKEEIINGRLYITIGTNRFIGGTSSLDLSLAKYKNRDKITIAIPIELARKDNRLTIKDGTMMTIINARDLYTLSVSKLDKGDKDSYVRIHIDKTTGDHLPRGKKAVSKAYELSFDYIYGKDSIDINQLLKPGKLFLEQDTIVYPNTKNTSLYKMNEETGNFGKLNSTTVDIKDKGKYILLSDR